jgi:hypothetical protein
MPRRARHRVAAVLLMLAVPAAASALDPENESRSVFDVWQSGTGYHQRDSLDRSNAGRLLVARDA